MGKQSKNKSSTSRKASTKVEQGPVPQTTRNLEPVTRNEALTGQQMTALISMAMTIFGLYQTSQGESYFRKPLSPTKREENIAMLLLHYKIGFLSTSWAMFTILLMWKGNKQVMQTYNTIYAVSPVLTSYVFYIFNTLDHTLPNTQNMLVAQMALTYFSSNIGIAPRIKVHLVDMGNLVLFFLSNFIMAIVGAVGIMGLKPESMQELDAIGDALWVKSFIVYGTSMALTLTFALLWLEDTKKRALLLFMAGTTYFFANSAHHTLPEWMTQNSSIAYKSSLAGALGMFIGSVCPSFAKNKQA